MANSGAVPMLADELGRILGFDASEMASYVASMSSAEAKAYLIDLLGDMQAALIDDLVDKLWGPPKQSSSKASKAQSMSYMGGFTGHASGKSNKNKKGKGKRPQQSASPVAADSFLHVNAAGFQAYKKADLDGEVLQATVTKPEPKAPPTVARSSVYAPSPSSAATGGDTASSADDFGSKSTKGGKGKPSYISVYSKEGQGQLSQLMPGRQICGCNCTKHALINNCVECGRIVCTQEGVGPCMTCGALVCSQEQQQLLNRGSKKSEQLMKKIQKDIEAGLAIALERKNKLLHFQNTSAKRMQVIDDESDYFSHDSNKWLSEKERAKVKQKEQQLRDQKERAKRSNVIQIDLLGRTITDHDASKDLPDIYSHDLHQDEMDNEHAAARDAIAREQAAKAISENPYLDPSRPRPAFIPSAPGDETFVERTKGSPQASTTKLTRLQDTELSLMQDLGLCLSMHQPWASLLVHGIKQHEGRSWYSPHRGRLWIAATAKPVDLDTVKELEDFYKSYHGEDINFPKEYPSSCLLGSVDVSNVAGQEEYLSQFPDGESSSPYVFVCENPQVLEVYFPIKGQHKIWKLDKDTHAAAKSGVRPVDPGNVRKT